MQGSASTSREDEENVALTTKGKKKFKKGPKKDGVKQHEEHKKDLSTVRCFACQNFGHYVGRCPKKKKKQQQTAASAKVEDFTARFERVFSLPWTC